MYSRTGVAMMEKASKVLIALQFVRMVQGTEWAVRVAESLATEIEIEMCLGGEIGEDPSLPRCPSITPPPITVSPPFLSS